jgi:hypothetical protein
MYDKHFTKGTNKQYSEVYLALALSHMHTYTY